MPFPVRQLNLAELPAVEQEFLGRLVDGRFTGTVPDGQIDTFEFERALSEGLFEVHPELGARLFRRFLPLEDWSLPQGISDYSLAFDRDGAVKRAGYSAGNKTFEFDFNHDPVGRLQAFLLRRDQGFFFGQVVYPHSIFSFGAEIAFQKWDAGKAEWMAVSRDQVLCGTDCSLLTEAEGDTPPSLLRLLQHPSVEKKNEGIERLNKAEPSILAELLTTLIFQEASEALLFWIVSNLDQRALARGIAAIRSSPLGALCLSRLYAEDNSRFLAVKNLIDVYGPACEENASGNLRCLTSTGLPKSDEIFWMLKACIILKHGQIGMEPSEWRDYGGLGYKVVREFLLTVYRADPKKTLEPFSESILGPLDLGRFYTIAKAEVTYLPDILPVVVPSGFLDMDYLRDQFSIILLKPSANKESIGGCLVDDSKFGEPEVEPESEPVDVQKEIEKVEKGVKEAVTGLAEGLKGLKTGEAAAREEAVKKLDSILYPNLPFKPNEERWKPTDSDWRRGIKQGVQKDIEATLEELKWMARNDSDPYVRSYAYGIIGCLKARKGVSVDASFWKPFLDFYSQADPAVQEQFRAYHRRHQLKVRIEIPDPK